MQILLGTGQPQFVIGNAAQSVGNRGLAGPELRSIADHHAIAGQPLTVVGEEFFQVLAADLLFPLDHEFQLNRQTARAFQPGLGA